jgi:hypothetical protein
MKFRTEVIPSGNATAVVIPPKVAKTLGPAARPLIAITINGHTWRSRVALMRGQRLVGISAANRFASAISEGDRVEVDLKLDTEPRIVRAPPDLAMALNHIAEAKIAFDRLPFGLKRKYVAAIEEAKTSEVRNRRIAALVARMRSDDH